VQLGGAGKRASGQVDRFKEGCSFVDRGTVVGYVEVVALVRRESRGKRGCRVAWAEWQMDGTGSPRMADACQFTRLARPTTPPRPQNRVAPLEPLPFPGRGTVLGRRQATNQGPLLECQALGLLSCPSCPCSFCAHRIRFCAMHRPALRKRTQGPSQYQRGVLRGVSSPHP
jgi:hypothetical protein